MQQESDEGLTILHTRFEPLVKPILISNHENLPENCTNRLYN